MKGVFTKRIFKKRREEQHMYCLEYVLKNQDLKKTTDQFHL
jgi:phospholipid N-methyltransferase